MYLFYSSNVLYFFFNKKKFASVIFRTKQIAVYNMQYIIHNSEF